MKIIKEIKIVNQDESTENAAIGADAINVDYNDSTVKDELDKLNKISYYYNNIATMKADTILKVGDMAITLGYYEPGDGGSATYNIVEDNTLIDDGGSVHALDNGLKAKLIVDNEIKELNVKQYGAKGDGITDDTNVFTTVFNITRQARYDIYIPMGQYVIKNDLPNLLSGINIRGDATFIRENRGSIIIDKRSSQNYLIVFTDVEGQTYNTGGGIQNISFRNLGDIFNKCLHIEKTSSGWLGIIENCKFAGYATSIWAECNDYRYLNCQIVSGSRWDRDNNEIHYAIILSSGCNENRFEGCHIEHNRYVMKVQDNAFLNYWINCKLEMSTSRMTYEELSPPITITSTSDYTPISFIGCSFINLDLTAYSNEEDSSFDYSNIPYLIDERQAGTFIKDCNFVCGAGSASSAINQSKQCRYVRTDMGTIQNCRFERASYLINSISMYNGIFSGNRIHCISGGTYNGIVSASKVILKEEILSRNIISNNMLTMGSGFSDDIYLSSYYHENNSYMRGNKNSLDKLGIFTADNGYCTMVIAGLTPTSQIFKVLKIGITNHLTNHNRGYFTLDVFHSSSNSVRLRLLNKENFVFDIPIICTWKENKLYIQMQFKSSSNPVQFSLEGLEKEPYYCYTDTDITELITNGDATITIDNSTSA